MYPCLLPVKLTLELKREVSALIYITGVYGIKLRQCVMAQSMDSDQYSFCGTECQDMLVASIYISETSQHSFSELSYKMVVDEIVIYILLY